MIKRRLIFITYRISFEDIKKKFSDKGATLISDSSVYENKDSVLEFICLKHPDKAQKTVYRNINRVKCLCLYCRANPSVRFNYDFVFNYFKQQGCELLSKEYINTDTHLDFICNCGNVDRVTFYSFKNLGRRCRLCTIERTNHSGAIWYYCDVKKYIESYDYRLITSEDDYINTRKKIVVSCEKDHTYPVTFKNFKKGRRCPVCNQSRGETEIASLLNKLKINYTIQREFFDLVGTGGSPLRFDFAIFDQRNILRLLIEYDGEFHFHKLYESDAHELLVAHDKIKNTYCKKNNIPLIRIPYWEFDNIDFILENVLSYFKLNNQTEYSRNIVHKLLVNDPNYRKPSPSKIIKNNL